MTSSWKILSLLVCVCLTSCGCEIGRSWFTMSSDSPTPFMGIDLLPRRKTSQLAPAKAGEHFPTMTHTEVQQVANKERPSLTERVKEIRLPSLPSVLKRDKEEVVAFPEVVGVEGLPVTTKR